MTLIITCRHHQCSLPCACRKPMMLSIDILMLLSESNYIITLDGLQYLVGWHCIAVNFPLNDVTFLLSLGVTNLTSIFKHWFCLQGIMR